jgi:hypothetical protein
MQVTAGNIHIHTSLRVVEITNLQGSSLQRIEISSINVQDLSNKVNDRSYSKASISSHLCFIDEMREDKRPLDVRIVSNEAKTYYKIDRLSFANLTRMNENGSTVSRRIRKSQVTWSNLGEGIINIQWRFASRWLR